jgi:hypothetical protein
MYIIEFAQLAYCKHVSYEYMNMVLLFVCFYMNMVLLFDFKSFRTLHNTTMPIKINHDQLESWLYQ